MHGPAGPAHRLEHGRFVEGDEGAEVEHFDLDALRRQGVGDGQGVVDLSAVGHDGDVGARAA